MLRVAWGVDYSGVDGFAVPAASVGSGVVEMCALFLVVSAEALYVLFCFKMFYGVIAAHGSHLVTCCIYIK